jgi:hypothetical protein
MRPSKPYWGGAGVLIYYQSSAGQYYALIGNQTKYLSDYRPDLKQYEYLFQNISFQEAMVTFGDIARRLSTITLFEEEPTRVQVTFDIPVWKTGYWRTHYRILPRSNNPTLAGIVKGGVEFQDKSPIDTALREVNDILGQKLIVENMKPIIKNVGFHYFSYEISESTAKEIENQNAVMQFTQIGKMQHLEFVEISELFNDISKINPNTTRILIHKFGSLFPKLLIKKKISNIVRDSPNNQIWPRHLAQL